MPSSAVIASFGNSSPAAATFSRRCATDEVPGIRRMLGARRRSHASATCIGVRPRRSATSDKIDDCSGLAAEWEERHIGDAVAGKIIDQGIVLSMGYVVRVLHADDRD